MTADPKRFDYVSIDGGIIYAPESIVHRLRLAFNIEDEECALLLSQHAADALEQLMGLAAEAIPPLREHGHADLADALTALSDRVRTDCVFDDDWPGDRDDLDPC
jgi:hypothetical protein